MSGCSALILTWKRIWNLNQPFDRLDFLLAEKGSSFLCELYILPISFSPGKLHHVASNGRDGSSGWTSDSSANTKMKSDHFVKHSSL